MELLSGSACESKRERKPAVTFSGPQGVSSVALMKWAMQGAKKTLLITGATGYLGQFVVQRLAASHKVCLHIDFLQFEFSGI